MRGSPESRYFAGRTALHYAVEEFDNSRRQAGQQTGLAARELWLKGYMFSEISHQLSNITSVLSKDIPEPTYFIGQYGIEKTGVDNLSDAISMYNHGKKLDGYEGEHTVTSSELYVALRVTEKYVVERTKTPQAIQTLRRDVKEATKHEDPKHKLNPDLLHQGIIFLREKVESTLTPDEFNKANRAFE